MKPLSEAIRSVRMDMEAYSSPVLEIDREDLESIMAAMELLTDFVDDRIEAATGARP